MPCQGKSGGSFKENRIIFIPLGIMVIVNETEWENVGLKVPYYAKFPSSPMFELSNL